MFFSEILKNNNILNNKIKNEDKIKLKVLSNITVNQLKPILEYSLNSHGIHSSVEIGEYDNIIKESMEILDEIPIIFWELCNITEGFSFEVENFSNNKIDLLKIKILADLDLLFKNLNDSKLVIFNKFSHTAFTAEIHESSIFQILVDDINSYLIANKPENFEIIEIDKLIALNSVKDCFNFRNFYDTKSLYTVNFLISYSNFLHPILRSITGKTKKCIVLDCDNTLWSGILGEDGPSNVKYNIDHIGAGKYFYFVHMILKSLKEKGVVLCLASKNNFSDVEDFFIKNKKNFMFDFDDFIVKKINWDNKHENIADIAKELNIGVDSIVFLDDSDFEINIANEFLPDVLALQVPKKLFEYPHLAISIKNLFYSKSQTKEDLNKSLMYNQNIQRSQDRSKFRDIEEYIKSLKIKNELSFYNLEDVERLSQLTQKTNQFNLSTKRYEVKELKTFNKSKKNYIISMKVSDFFGDLGITGLCMINIESEYASIDTFVMSCRVLGRKIEFTFLNEILKYIFNEFNDISYVVLEFIPSHKNDPIRIFLEALELKKEKIENGNIKFIFNKPLKINQTIHEVIWNRN
tara:strand:- start:2202 stop:3935 length:1734 start_codon:yes stop_codon:yes gene_type:complete